MPKDKLTDYSATNASNTDVGGVNTDEGMLPSAVNNAIREVMTHLKNFAAGTDGIDVLSLADDTATNAIKLQAPSSVTTTTTLTLPDGDGTDGQVLSTDGSGALSFVNTTPAPNLIINGDMAVAQRGDVTGATFAYGGADRYEFISAGGSIVTLSQDTDAPSNQGFSNSQKIDVTTADTSLAAGDYAIIRQAIEAQNLQHLLYGTSEAKKVTLQFWVKSPKTGTHIVEIYHGDANYFNSQSYTIATADTWQKVTMTFDGYQTTSIDNDNGLGMYIHWWLAAGSTFSGGTLTENTWHNTQANRVVGQVNVMDSTSNDFYITGVKLEVGSTATPFQHESYAENLQKCQRYYVQQTTHIQTPIGGSMIVPIYFPTTMRATPTTANVAAGSTAGGLTVEQIGGLHTQGAYFQVASSANSNYRLNRIDEYIAEL